MATIQAIDLTQGSSPQTEIKQPSPSEPTAEAPAKADEPLSSKFALLAKKEKAIRSKYVQKEQELQAREQALKAKEAGYETDYVPKSKLAEILASDPSSLGLDWDQVAQAILNQKPEETAIRQLKSEIAALKNTQAESTSKIEEQSKQAYEQAVKQITNDVKILVDSDPAFETIKETQSVDAVVELIKQQFDEDGTLLSVEEAAKEVEDYLFEQATKLAQLNKVKNKLQPPPAEAPKPELNKKPALTTLTNQVMANTTRNLSDRERRQRAIQAFKGQLTS